MASAKSMLLLNIFHSFKTNTICNWRYSFPQRYILRSLRGTRLSVIEQNLLNEINETVSEKPEALSSHPNEIVLEEKNYKEERDKLSSKEFLHILKGNTTQEAKDESGPENYLFFNRSLLKKKNFEGDERKKEQEKSDHSNEQLLNKELLKSTASKSFEITLENQYDMLAKVITPYYKMSYKDQLKKKYNNNVSVLRQLGHELKSNNVVFTMGSDKLPCPLQLVVPSPVIGAYRNKDEFNVRRGVDGNPKTVGFFAERTSENPEAFSIEPDELINTKDSHKAVTKDFQNYIRQSSLPVCYDFKSGGHWRNLIVRSNIQGDVMAIIVIHPQKMTEEELEAEKNKLRNYFSLDKDRSYNLKSLYFQACCHTRCTHEQAPFQLLLGDPCISESINGLKFQISPESFFQINTLAAESMYNKLLQLTKASKATTLLDVCCGIGTIGLTFAPHVHRVIGIDISTQAIKDAKINAELNDIRNAHFICGRSDHVLLNVISEIYAEDLIAIVNPSRNGLNKSVTQTLRQCKHLKKIVYISCKPEGQAMNDFIQLCKPAAKHSSLGAPFLPMLAFPVDLFPYTAHCELVILFQRL